MPRDENVVFRPAFIVTNRQGHCSKPEEIAEVIGLFYVSSKKHCLNEFLAFRVRLPNGSEGNVPFKEVESGEYSLLSPDNIELRRKRL
ncbi:MAG: hypothetical protein A2528_01495 [Candidatus Staskawiczbacteria bacterium RIFOXYD2_FULL_37_9]|nr:MAG: hypothetical protein A2528_01495 [Candidatus Staskawiczbacteria bacterium RIFOXYD2_FULL_37_9]